MKKTFPLQPEGKHPDRVLDRVKHDVRKYLKRERSRALPEGVDFWDFDCKVGASEETAQAVHLASVIACIDHAAKEQAKQVYVEIWAKHGVRTKRPASAAHEPQAHHSAVATDENNDCSNG